MSALLVPSAQAAVSGGVSASQADPPAPEPPAQPAPPESAGGGVAPGVDPNGKPRKARLVRGRAVAPLGAPPQVQQIIAAANRIAFNPYRYGGGHDDFILDGRKEGYDCSGTVSFALNGAGLMERPLASGDFFNWGKPGAGKWVTVYTKSSHMYVVVAGLRFDTSALSEGGRKGSRWSKKMRSSGGYKVRHPDGL